MNKRAGISRAPPTRAKTSAARISRGGRRSGGSDAEKDAGRCANKFVSARDNSYLYYLERGRRGGAVRLRPTMNEPLEAIALQLTPGIGSKGAAHLLEVFGDARRIFAASREELVERAELHAAPAEALVRRVAFGAAERELKHCRRAGFRAIASTDAAYPPLLREIPDYPPVLYLWGDPAVLQRRTVAVVGTRTASVYGAELCRRIVCELSERVPGLAVASGTADGIDRAAHRAALEAGIGSVALSPLALPAVTPACNAALVRQVVERGGALVTEQPATAPSKGVFYVPRNRLIAGLAAGCLVVESPVNGGALHTARFADGYHRTVMAVSGRPADEHCGGTNHLLRTRLAQAVCTADDVIEALQWDLGADPAQLRGSRSAAPLTPDEAALLAAIGPDEVVTVDRLCERTGLAAARVAALVVLLEIEGRLASGDGERYRKRCD